MVVGKTSSSMTVNELFGKYGEANIVATVFPEIDTLPCLICSPLRKDSHPSFSIYLNKQNHIRYKDFADRSTGGLMDLLCSYWNCGIQKATDKVISMLGSTKDVLIRTTANGCMQREGRNTDIQVKVRPWQKHDYEYWGQYGVPKEALKYAEVYPISHRIIVKDNAKSVIPADKYAYCFVERKEGKVSLKIYQPLNPQRKWRSKMDGSVIGLWTKIPEFGDRVIICSSLKDALCVYSQLGIPTLCLQGEGYGMSNTAIEELRRRYKKVFISFDTDKAGLEDGAKLAEATGFINVVPNLGECKDYSDYYKSLGNKEEFKELKHLFN